MVEDVLPDGVFPATARIFHLIHQNWPKRFVYVYPNRD